MPTETRLWLPLIVFIFSYTLLAILPKHRSRVAMGGAMILILTGNLCGVNQVTQGYLANVAAGLHDAIANLVHWNVMGLFFGTLVLADLFLLSRAPAVIAESLLSRLSSARLAMLLMCMLAGTISIFVENVAVVLLLAPIAFSLAEKMKMSPVPMMIGIAISSNLQGTATMIGDPPSMILAGYMKMNFFDFFVYKGRLGIFFMLQVGALASLFVLGWFFRKYKHEVQINKKEKALSWIPAILLAVLMLGLTLTTVFDPDFNWFAGTLALSLAGLALIWNAKIARWQSSRLFIRGLDWDTTFFLIGAFILVGGLSNAGWLEYMADAIVSRVGGSLPMAFVFFIVISVVLSGFVDNVPYLLAMIPVVQFVANTIGTPAGGADPLPLLLFGTLIGACLGGNITPIGASANVVTLGMLRKQGYTVGFGPFMRISIPFTIISVVASCLFVWWVWSS